MARPFRHSEGFTPIEISIVLVIIGPIVGGILVGDKLIRAAEFLATLRQMEDFQSGANVFRMKHN